MVFLIYSVTQKFCMATPANQCKIIIIIIIISSNYVVLSSGSGVSLSLKNFGVRHGIGKNPDRAGGECRHCVLPP
jgi:hypothetical protein